MVQAQPRGLERQKVARLLSGGESNNSIAGRIDALSRQLLGTPYRSNPLIGSATEPEVFTASLEHFDCVTYVESVLALARASTVENFAESLRKIRYDSGVVRWNRRNHYTTDWIRNNVRQGTITRVTTSRLPEVSRERVLSILSGLPPRTIRIKCVPKSAAASLMARMKTGDLVFFVSTRRNLDVFHLGVAVVQGEKTLMRHASRSRGCVVEQELGGFLKMNRMAGVIVMRPREMPRHAAVRNRSSVAPSPVLVHRRSRRQAVK